MKQLFLIRHAKSSWDNLLLLDIERPLSKRGKKQAKLLGQKLLLKGAIPQLVISSPAVRAQKTAKRLIKSFHYSKKHIEINPLIYSGSVDQIIEFICSIDNDFDCVFIVGHNPLLLELGKTLTGAKIEELPTSAYLHLKFDGQSWKEVKQGSCQLAFIGIAR
jgi:phosphohistidine phosphatase